MKINSVKDWESFFKDRGLSPDLINSYLTYISSLEKSNVPIIFENEHLSQLLGISQSVLNKMVNSTNSFYRVFQIPKKRGGKRDITAPYPSLLHCQRWIYNNILLNEKPHHSVHGFMPNKSIISNAKAHLGAKSILKMDLKDFFPSIPINWVIQYFKSKGYAENVAFYLSSICCFDGNLAQGAATSPYLSNLLLKGLDKRIHRLCFKYRLRYTRYADDMTISGEYVPHKLIGIINGIVTNFGLSINQDKTSLLIDANKKIVTGISVSGERLTIPRTLKRELKKVIFYIEKYGFSSHIANNKIKNPYYLDSLIGKFNFWLQVEPDNDFAKESRQILIDEYNY